MADRSPPAPVLGPRPFHVTDSDQRGVVMSLSVLFVVYAFMISGMRLAAKRRSIGLDDWLAFAAMGLAIPQFVSIIIAVVEGFGTSYDLLSQSEIDALASALRAGDVLFLLSLFVAKCSLIWLCRRLFAVWQHGSHLICGIVMGICAVWCLGSLIAINVGCSATKTIRASEGQCTTVVTLWAVVGALDSVTEIIIYGLSIAVVFPLQMSWSRKFQASACFILRIPLVVFVVLNVKSLSDFTSASSAGVSYTRPIMFREGQVLYSLLSASIPTLNQYLRKFNTQQVTHFGYTFGQSGSGRRSGYEMSTVNSKKSRNGGNMKNWTNNSTEKVDELSSKSTGSNFNPPSHAHYNATVEGHNNGPNDGISSVSQEDGSTGRHNSDEYIIRKDVRYEVRHED